MGDAQARLADGAPHALRAAQLQVARRWYEESLSIWIELEHQHKLAPDQIDRPGQIEARIEQCNTAARLPQSQR